jgi:hypothetical protein
MADSGTTSGGTSVTLLVPAGSTVPGTNPPPVAPPSHIPFTGFDLSTALVLAVLMLAVGTLLVRTGRRPAPPLSRRT